MLTGQLAGQGSEPAPGSLTWQGLQAPGAAKYPGPHITQLTAPLAWRYCT